MSAFGRCACAALVACLVVLAGVSRAVAAPVAPAAAVAPLRPAPLQLPEPPASLGGAPCLPFLGCDPLASLGKDAARALAGAIFSEFGAFVADGVAAILTDVTVAISDTTRVTLDAQWFRDHFDVMRSLALLILLPMMLVGLVGAVIRRDASQLLRAGVVYVPVAVLGAVASIELTDRALQLTDWATSFVTGNNSSTQAALRTLGDAVNRLTTPLAPGLGTFLAIVVLLVLMFGALLIWIELLLRTGAIYVVVLFLPIALSGLVWKGTVSWTRRMVEVLVALLLSKFVIVVVIDLAAGMISAGAGIGTVMQGATLLLLAGFAPFALLRLIPIVESGVIGHLERMERRPVAAATRVATTVASAAIGGIEMAAGGASVAGNGGDAYASFRQTLEPGGQLNDVKIPGGGFDSGSPGSSAGPGSSGDGSADGSADGAGAMSLVALASAASGVGDPGPGGADGG